ncbi:condensation domain-containing protein, partial [Streptomyces sp. NPDC056728]
MNDSTTAVAPEALLADIWKEILGVGEVGPDDDFFSLGGDSLLALKVIGAAQEQGLSLSLLDLFKNPTPRGACRSLTPATDRPAHGALDQLSVLDRARVPADAEDAYPAARLQLGLIYESLVSDGACYLDVISRTVLRPLDPVALRAALDLLSARHPLLRTRFDLGTFSEPMQLVQKEAPIPLVVADHGDLTGAAATEAYERVMTELAEPYDAESAPLLRVHAAATAPRSFRLSYSFHHAILDGWSESVFFNELVVAYAALLDGTRPEFADPAPYAEFVRLEREALRDEQSVRHFRDLQAELPPQREASSAEPEPPHAGAARAPPGAPPPRPATPKKKPGRPPPPPRTPQKKTREAPGA